MYDKIIKAISNRQSIREDFDGHQSAKILEAIDSENFEKGTPENQPSFSKASIKGNRIIRNGMSIVIVTGSFMGTFTQVTISHVSF